MGIQTLEQVSSISIGSLVSGWRNLPSRQT
jgi:hypothetical protein